MVHRAQLEVPAVGEDLLVQFGVQDGRATPEPLGRMLAVEEAPGKRQRLRVFEQVVAQQVRLHLLREKMRLHASDSAISGDGATRRADSQRTQFTMRNDSGYGSQPAPAGARFSRIQRRIHASARSASTKSPAGPRALIQSK